MTKPKLPKFNAARAVAEAPAITTEEAVKRLGKLAGILERQMQTVSRRRSWRPSEIAMSIADLVQDVQAIRKATAAMIAADVPAAAE